MIVEFLIAFGIAISTMLVLWLYYLRTQNPGVVDVGWGLGILFSGLWYLSGHLNSLSGILLASLLLLWGARLCGFLFWTRIRLGHVDKRYTDLAQGWKSKPKWGFLVNFLFQACLLTFIAIPFLWLHSTTPSPWQWLTLLVVLLGIIGETIADWQLHLFKQNPTDRVCQKGLWYYSRHPNYFFEILVWLGFAGFMLFEPQGYFAMLSPLLLMAIMVFITGPITERGSLSSKGEAYRTYQRHTAMIIPWFKKKTG